MVNNFSETLREVIMLKEDAHNLRRVNFNIKHAKSINQLRQLIDKTWQVISKWRYERYSQIYDSMQSYERVLNINGELGKKIKPEDASMEASQDVCETIDGIIEGLNERISEKEEELSKLYDKFAKTTGDLQTTFESEDVKRAIINKLLKANLKI